MDIALNVPAKTFVSLDLKCEPDIGNKIEDGMDVHLWGECVGRVDSHLVGTTNTGVLIVPTCEVGSCQQFINHSEDIKSIEIKDGYIDVIM